MSDSPDPRTRLLAETLHGEWSDGPSLAMARRAARQARRRRHLRRGSLALIAAAGLGAVVFLQPPYTPPLAPAPVPIVQRGYEIISDDEFIALLRDRPLLVLPSETGAKKFVLLGN